MDFLVELIHRYQKLPPLPKKSQLSFYVNKKTGRLDMEKFKPVLLRMMREKSFFKRFDMATLSKFLPFGKPVTYSERNQLVFPKDKIGVITHGSVFIYSHSKNILEPEFIAKYGQGRIIGHSSDDGISTSP